MRALAILSLFLLSACGQAGDLYLPDQKPADQNAPTPATPAPADDAKKKEPK